MPWQPCYYPVIHSECSECGDDMDYRTVKVACANCYAVRRKRLNEDYEKWSKYYETRPMGMPHREPVEKICKNCRKPFKTKYPIKETCTPCQRRFHHLDKGLRKLV